MAIAGEAATLVFVLALAALVFGLVQAVGDSARSVARLDRILLSTFSLFLFVAWFFEPYVVYLCPDWDLRTSDCQATLTGWLWHYYATTFDPIFLHLPLWLRIVCSLDTFIFGPFYLASIYAFATGQQSTRWYRLVALPMSGALLYSTVVYFAYEARPPSCTYPFRRHRGTFHAPQVIAEAHRASLLWVFLINLPWTLAPVLLVLRLELEPPAGRELKLKRKD